MKRDREEAARREGMAYALKIVKDAAAAGGDPVKALEDECEYRNTHITSLAISRKQEKEYVDEVSGRAVMVITSAACQTLYEVFGFGKIRIERFRDRIMEIYDEINDGAYTVNDIRDALKDVCDVEIEVRR